MTEFEHARWEDIDFILGRKGPLSHPHFVPGTGREFLHDKCRILVVGAGGLGCEILKNLALSGFRNIHVIDLDTIDISNLNRQFLFRDKDVSRPKAVVAAEFINRRVPGANVTAHHCAIENYGEDFYRQFNLVICGLDNIRARQWLNQMFCGFVVRERGVVEPKSVIPVIDGGTEGFKGQSRVILPGISACLECTMFLYPQQEKVPLCTIAATPRNASHCILYASLQMWPLVEPFGKGVPVDGDNPEHIQWITATALARAQEFGISGVDFRTAQGVIKNVIPAIASTNAIISAACTNEAFKIAANATYQLDNYMFFNGAHGVYTHTYRNQKLDDCSVCSQPPLQINADPSTATVLDLLQLIMNDNTVSITEPVIKYAGKVIYDTNDENQDQAVLGKSLASFQTNESVKTMVFTVQDPSLPKELNVVVEA